MIVVKQFDPVEWETRLQQAAKLVEHEIECLICGGHGGWPVGTGLVFCKPCQGSGSIIPTSRELQ